MCSGAQHCMYPLKQYSQPQFTSTAAHSLPGSHTKMLSTQCALCVEADLHTPIWGYSCHLLTGVLLYVHSTYLGRLGVKNAQQDNGKHQPNVAGLGQVDTHHPKVAAHMPPWQGWPCQPHSTSTALCCAQLPTRGTPNHCVRYTHQNVTPSRARQVAHNHLLLVVGASTWPRAGSWRLHLDLHAGFGACKTSYPATPLANTSLASPGAPSLT